MYSARKKSAGSVAFDTKPPRASEDSRGTRGVGILGSGSRVQGFRPAIWVVLHIRVPLYKGAVLALRL